MSPHATSGCGLPGTRGTRRCRLSPTPRLTASRRRARRSPICAGWLCSVVSSTEPGNYLQGDREIALGDRLGREHARASGAGRPPGDLVHVVANVIATATLAGAT